ncbi:MAG: sugar transferase [Candidatus Gracilibacteria bacterium]|nr:sugar transferase [Candidatus Gracilibacteria bacterium]
MKKHELIFGFLKVPLDFIIIFGAFFLAREIRLITDLIPGIQLPIQTIDSNSLFGFALFGAFLHLIIFSLHKLYFIQICNSKIKEFLEILYYSFYAFTFFLVLVFLGKGFIYETDIPRGIIVFAYFFGTIGIIIQRILFNKIQYSLLQKGIIPKRNLLLINNQNNEKILHILQDIKHANIYNIIGYIHTQKNPDLFIPYKGNISSVKHLFETKQCDEILYIDSDFNKKDLLELWETSRIFGIRYRYLANSFDITQTHSELGLIHNIPVIEIANTSLSNWGKIGKRLFDICASSIALIISIPLIISIALLVKLEDPSGPIFFKNRRVGEKNKLFDLYKFRYMKWEYCVKDAYGVKKENDSALEYEKQLIQTQSSRHGPLYKIQNDPRKTKIGNFIEKYSLDEVPQFFNILKGDMSLVGPRPHQPREVEKYSLQEKRLLTIKPGLTGMAQVNGREENDFTQETKLDIFYIENWTFLLDFKIILKTFSVILERIKK